MEAVAHLTVSGRSIPDPRELLPPKRRPIFNRTWRVTYGVFTMIDGSKSRPLVVANRNLLSFFSIPDHAVAFEFFEERTQRVRHNKKAFLYTSGPIHWSNPTFFHAVDGSPQQLMQKGYINDDDLAWSKIPDTATNIVLAYPYKKCECGPCRLLLPMQPLTYRINAKP